MKGRRFNIKNEQNKVNITYHLLIYSMNCNFYMEFNIFFITIGITESKNRLTKRMKVYFDIIYNYANE